MRSLTKGDTEGIVVEVTFEVKFIQSTMFRYFIESSTTVEVQKWFDDFFLYVKRICDDHKTSPDPTVVNRIKELGVSNGVFENAKNDDVSPTESDNDILEVPPMRSATVTLRHILFENITYLNHHILEFDWKTIMIISLLSAFVAVAWITSRNLMLMNDLQEGLESLIKRQNELEMEFRHLQHHLQNSS
jgi:hypothetical protein